MVGIEHRPPIRYGRPVRVPAFTAALLCCAASAAAQTLPQKDGPADGASAAELFTAPPLVLEAAELPGPAPDETALTRARRERDAAKSRADRWVRLQRAGVLSKVEAERASRQASQANLRHEQVHVGLLRAQLAELKARPAEAALIESDAAALQTAETLCSEAGAQWQKLERALAETNVARRRVLVRHGLSSKGELHRAESELARVQQTAR